MRPLLSASLLLLAACGAHADKPATTTPPAYAPGDVDWTAMHGVLPEQPLAPPEFSVTAHTGEVRTAEQLKGHPTVIWFYPMAGTPG